MLNDITLNNKIDDLLAMSDQIESLEYLKHRYEEELDSAKKLASAGNCILIENLTNCARCQNDHHILLFNKLTFSHNKFTHWANCPNNNEPIMLTIESDEDDQD